MSAERFEITLSDDGLIHISGSNGRRASLITPDGIIGYVTHGAIRQQARDLDQLRADLAAAVAERDRMAQRIKDLDAECSVIAKDCTYAEQQNDTLRARLAAIDGAPTVATVCVVPSTQRVYVSADVEQYELPPIGTHLIARPAKD